MVLLQPGVVFMICAVTRNHVKTVFYVPADCEEQGSYVCSDMNDCRCIVEKEGQGRVL